SGSGARAYGHTVRALVVLGLVGLLAGEARGVECAPMLGAVPSLGRVDARVRLRFVDEGLARGAHRARRWAWGFGGTYAVLTLGPLTAAGFLGADERRDYFVDALGSAV